MGQLSHGGVLSSAEIQPVGVALTHPVTRISAGRNHACVVDDQREIYCWGSNLTGGLGIGEAWLDTPGTSTPQPVINDGGSPALDIQSGA
ncbi:MAG: hypothetical protein IPK13_12680 [Deltaproteobacteria bacterium]|nr:hypothetical protein [Deltaproteobacteria bacterium]